MKEISLKAMVDCAKIKDDIELDSLIRPQFDKKFGKGVYAVVKEVLQEGDDNEELNLNEIAQRLLEVCPIDNVVDLILMLPEAKKNERLPISTIMEFYRSEDIDLEKMSKKYIVINFTNYVHDVIHSYYSTYSSKYWEELYHCGVIGLIKAMKNYDEEKGKFTTYSKRFIFHEISEQLNFHKNDSTVYFNNMQKKVQDAKEKLIHDGFEPTVENIALYTDLKPEMVQRELDVIERTKFCYLDDEEVKKQPSSFSSSPEQLCIEEEKKSAVRDSIERLPYLMRMCIILKYDYDYTNDVIAKMLDITTGKVKTYHNKAIQMMRKDPDLLVHAHDYVDEAETQMLKYAQRPIGTKADADEQIQNVLNFNIFGNQDEETPEDSLAQLEMSL